MSDAMHVSLGALFDHDQVLIQEVGERLYAIVSRTQRCECGGHDDECERECLWGYRVLGMIAVAEPDEPDAEHDASETR
jgi:hypothetical protein